MKILAVIVLGLMILMMIGCGGSPAKLPAIPANSPVLPDSLVGPDASIKIDIKIICTYPTVCTCDDSSTCQNIGPTQ